MIILEEAPKLPTDPFVGPTIREQPDIEAQASSSRPPSPIPTLPDYETSEAQQPTRPKPSERRKFWFARVGRLISYALVVYSVVVVVVGIPMFVLRSKSHKFKWPPDDDDDGMGQPSQQASGKQMDMNMPGQHVGETLISCNHWLPLGGPSPGLAVLRQNFPLDETISLQVNASAKDLEGYFTGTLTVDMNPEKNSSSAVLLASARYSNSPLFDASTTCVTQAGNTTQVMIKIPKRTGNSSDTMEMDFTLLLPQAQKMIKFDKFVTQLPTFKQTWASLPRVVFGHLRIVGSGSPITVGSVSATSVRVQTSNAEISGNFSASERIHLDTVNGAVFANVSLRNNMKQKKNTRLLVETGNGPMLVNVNLTVEERVFFSAPKHRNFETIFRNFNGPMNVSLAHSIGSEPARIAVTADNSQGPIDVYLDSLYTGVFDVRTKLAKAQVQESVVSDPSVEENNNGDNQGHELHFARRSNEQIRGWIGDSRKPELFDRNKISRVEVINSLGPVTLHVAQLKSPTSTVQR